MGRLPPKFLVSFATTTAFEDEAAVETATASAAAPCRATVVSNTRLTAPTHFQDVRRIVLAVPPTLTYEFVLHTHIPHPIDVRVPVAGRAHSYAPGDAAAIAPRHLPEVVDAALVQLGLADQADARLHIRPCPEGAFFGAARHVPNPPVALSKRGAHCTGAWRRGRGRAANALAVGDDRPHAADLASGPARRAAAVLL